MNLNIDPKYKALASVALTTALGAALTYLVTTVQGGAALPSTAADWKAIGVGALVAAFSAVVHLLQTPPAAASAEYKAARRGFAVVRDLVFVTAFAALVFVAVALLAGCVALSNPNTLPDGVRLEQCVQHDVETRQSLGQLPSVFDLVAAIVEDCGGDVLDVLRDLTKSENAAVAADARMVDGDGALRAKLQRHVAARLAAKRGAK
jgi:hypothetical protein